MRRVLGVAAACAMLVVAGCGGTAELDSEETETVSLARATVASAVADGSLKPADEQKLEALMILCRDKPLAEADNGDTMRQVLDELAPQLKGASPEWSKKMQTLATNGCD